MKIKHSDTAIKLTLEHQAELVALRWAIGTFNRSDLRNAILRTSHTDETVDVLFGILDKLYDATVGLKLPLQTDEELAGPLYCRLYDKTQRVVVERA